MAGPTYRLPVLCKGLGPLGIDDCRRLAALASVLVGIPAVSADTEDFLSALMVTVDALFGTRFLAGPSVVTESSVSTALALV